MTIAALIKHVVDEICDGLWLVGGIGASAELSLGDFGPAGDEPCPNESRYPRCSNQEASSCPSPCSISSSTLPSR